MKCGAGSASKVNGPFKVKRVLLNKLKTPPVSQITSASAVFQIKSVVFEMVNAAWRDRKGLGSGVEGGIRCPLLRLTRLWRRAVAPKEANSDQGQERS